MCTNIQNNKSVLSFITGVEETLCRSDMLRAGDGVIAGISGGADSVCLLLVLCFLREKMGFRLRAVHVHHGLRENAEGDLAFVRELCGRLDIPCEVYRVNAAEYAREHKIGVEEAGRILRYDAFERECVLWEEKDDISCRIAVAHHMEDQAETVLFHIGRGSTITGLRGMLPVSGRIIRPLLRVERGEIENFLNDLEQDWRLDESNEDLQYARNLIRRQILPLMTKGVNAGTTRHLCALAENAAEIEEYLENRTREACGRCAYMQTDLSRLDISKLNLEESTIRKRVIYAALAEAAGKKKDIETIHIEAILGIIRAAGGEQKILSMPYDITVRKQAGVLYFEKGETFGNTDMTGIPLSEAEYTCKIAAFDGDMTALPAEKYTKWFDYDKIGMFPVFRNRQSGDRITISENGSGKKISRFMIDEKIPSQSRDLFVMPAIGREILWIPGYRMNAYYKVTEKTKNILQIQWNGR